MQTRNILLAIENDSSEGSEEDEKKARISRGGGDGIYTEDEGGWGLRGFLVLSKMEMPRAGFYYE